MEYPLINSPTLSLREIDIDTWYQEMPGRWAQGEHITLMGPTGTGKTTVAQRLLDAREYVCVLAVKEHDDTLKRFLLGHEYGRERYWLIRKWPPDFPHHRVVFWPKPKAINDEKEQSELLWTALNAMYLSGGWCVYFDEAGYISGTLGLGKALAILLNQGRSSYISVVATVTRPKSMVARVPVEAMSQARHHLIFRYSDYEEQKTCARIVGVSPLLMQQYQARLEYHRAKNGTEYSDFLYFRGRDVTLVKNVSRET